MDEEVWKVITDFSDYQVSSLGRVKSLKFGKEKILKQIKDSGKYFQVNLYKNGKENPKRVHTLVFETHKERLENNYDIHHTNENKEDNFIDNLKKIPKSEHLSFHKFGKKHSKESIKKMSESKTGKNNPNYKYSNTSQKYINIKIDIENGKLSQRQMSKKHDVCRKTISKIKQEILKEYTI